MLPMHARFPGTVSIPRVEIAVLPTPVERFSLPIAESAVASLAVKRDDISGEAYGGNKVRKLEFTLGQALAEGRRAVITFGAAGSNHVLATAIYGARLGLEVHAVLTPQAITGYLRANLLADLAVGAVLHVADSFESAPRTAVVVRSELTARDGIEPLVIPFGGTSAAGTLGFVNAAFELAEQVEAGALVEPDVVYLPLGSMGTAAGLAIGFASAAMRTRVVGVQVVPGEVAGAEALDAVVSAAVARLCSADSTFPVLTAPDLALEIRSGFLGEGYAVPTAEGTEAVALAEQSGLHLEGTYTGKALAALIADARAGRLDGERVLFWNTYNSRPLETAADAKALPRELRDSYFEEGGAT
jgi:1-aminocyclopropane-1-carboxylate deaminase/D-cysteine desulfhydrase-like pyridoxal-dependent ACC family enzyme